MTVKMKPYDISSEDVNPDGSQSPRTSSSCPPVGDEDDTPVIDIVTADSSPSPTSGSPQPAANAKSKDLRSKHQCQECGLQLSSRNCLYKHRLRKHSDQKKKKSDATENHVLCPDCRDDKGTVAGFVTTGDLIQHLNSYHGHNLVVERQTFKCWDDFLQWKALEEKMTKSWFIKKRADRNTQQYKSTWFNCNRAGKFVSKSKGKRAMRSQGTAKTGCSCPAYITTRTDHLTWEVEAEYCLHHVGHKQENTYNRISKEMRTSIAGKLT